MGASSIGRDLGPRVSSCLHSGLTADCTSLEIGDHTDPKTKTEYKNLLYQIRPAFWRQYCCHNCQPGMPPTNGYRA